MVWVIEVLNKQGIFDAVGHDVKRCIQDLGVKGVKDVSFSQIYRIYGKIDSKAAERIARELLIDKISEEYRINAFPEKGHGIHVIEIAYNAGVMDPVEESVLKGIKDLGVEGAEGVHTAKRYIIKGAIHPEKARFIADKLLYNKTIQHIVKKGLSEISSSRPSYKFKLVE